MVPLLRGDLVERVYRDIGHFGEHWILDRLRRNYWWKNLDLIVAQVVRASMPCARIKAGFRVSGKELQQIHLQDLMYRWASLLLDLCQSINGEMTFFLVCIEHCTKWSELKALGSFLSPPLPPEASANVARAFLSRYGVSGVALTKGTEF